MKTEKLLAGLNKEQLEAVTYNDGHLLIIAGAGTGKTKVLTTKIAYLINEKLALPEEILALTFTEKAASEMEERVDILVPYGMVNTNISTFHSFGEKIISEFAFHLGINIESKLLSQDEQIIFLNERIDQFENLNYFRPGSNPLKYVEHILGFISRCKDELIKPDDLIIWASKKIEEAKDDDDKTIASQYLELGNIYKQYQQLLQNEGFMDFGDQINQVINLLERSPKVKKELKSRFKYILIDEFQDTNYAQSQMIKLLSGIAKVTVVGDDDQSIYKFRGASIANIMNFTETFPDTKIIVLNKNYRSTQDILDASYKLIQYNNPNRLEIKQQISKKLIATHSGQEPIVKVFSDHYAEAKFISDDIKQKITKDKLQYSDFAIITRSNNNYKHIIDQLSSEGIPYITSASISLFETEPVQICINLINFVTQRNHSLSLFMLLTSPIYNLNAKELSKVSGLAKRKNREIYHIVENITDYFEELSITQEFSEELKNALSDIDKYVILARNCQTTREFLYKFLSEKKYIKVIATNSLAQQHLVNFFKQIEEFEKTTMDKKVHNYINYLEHQIEVGATFDLFEHYELNAVNVLTAHSSKGLEFNTVYLPALTKDYFPITFKKDPLEIPQELIKEELPKNNNFHLEEERRLFYVAMTRAKENLIMSFSQNYGGVRLKKPSPFLIEATDINFKEQELIQSQPEDILKKQSLQLDLFKDNKPVIKRILLNAHKIDDYLTCPLKYNFVHNLKIPIGKNPNAVYGSAIHKTIEFILKSRMESKPITLKESLEIFDKNWDSEGFNTIQAEERRKEQGVKAIESFYNNQETIIKKVKDIEQSFGFKFSKITQISGRYDIIFESDNGLEIGDFKTSNIQDQKKADERLKKSRQMTLYALAYYKEHNKMPDKLTMIFVDSNFQASTKPNQKMIEKIEKDIQKVEEGIIKQDFKATPNPHFCKYCAYKQICPNKKI